MTVKKYPARIYRGRARKQTLRHPVTGFLIGCTDTCLAMAIDDATCGTVNVSELDVRMLTDEWPVKPSNKSPGLNQDQLVMASKKLHFRYAKCNGQGWAALAAAIRENRRVVAQLWYAGIGGGNIGHAVLLEALRDRPGAPVASEFLYVDPYTGKRDWILASKVHDAMADLAAIEGKSRDELFWGKTAVLPYIAAGAK